MRKVFGTLAALALMGSQAEAAIITGPTSVVAGQSYTYTYDTGPVDLLDGYDFFILNLLVSDGVNDDYFGRFGFPFPTNNLFTFNWTFSVTGPAFLSVRSTLESYAGAEITPNPGGVPSIFKDDDTRVELIEFGPDGLQVSVVPIGGTLPMLLTALGVAGLVARRRAAKEAVPA